MSTLGERLKELRGGHSQKWLADRLGIPQTTLSNYENNKSELSFAMIDAISTIFAVNVEWLLFGRGPMRRGEEAASHAEPACSPDLPHAPLPAVPEVDVIGLAACGIAGWYNHTPIAIKAPYPYGPPEGIFAVIAIGSSMIPDGIRQGNLLFCSHIMKPYKGDAVFIEKNDGTASVKKFVSRDGEWLHLAGWLDPDPEGMQKPYSEKVSMHVIKQTAVVAMVKRRA